MRHANHRGFNNQFAAHQTAFNFRSSKAVAADIQHIINAAHDPKESVAVAARAIARQIHAWNFSPIRFNVALAVSVNAAQHARPWLANDKQATGVRGKFVALLIHNRGVHTGKWQSA